MPEGDPRGRNPAFFRDAGLLTQTLDTPARHNHNPRFAAPFGGMIFARLYGQRQPVTGFNPLVSLEKN